MDDVHAIHGSDGRLCRAPLPTRFRVPQYGKHKKESEKTRRVRASKIVHNTLVDNPSSSILPILKQPPLPIQLLTNQRAR